MPTPQLTKVTASILALGLIIGLSALGYLLGSAALDVKQFERSVTVKGLSEREFSADVVIWPIQFTVASNDLNTLYKDIENHTQLIEQFLLARGIQAKAISVAAPAIRDKSAQAYGGEPSALFRYSAEQMVTVYSENIDAVRKAKTELSALGKQGIVLTGGNYLGQTEYLFTRLNEVKPEMIEEATRKAREVAEKFAADSQSQLGKIKRARQGQFSISARDNNNPHIKKVRVVSTLEYYLSD